MAIEVGDFVADKFKVDGSIDFANEMVFGDQLFECHHLDFILLRARVFKHVTTSMIDLLITY